MDCAAARPSIDRRWERPNCPTVPEPGRSRCGSPSIRSPIAATAPLAHATSPSLCSTVPPATTLPARSVPGRRATHRRSAADAFLAHCVHSRHTPPPLRQTAAPGSLELCLPDTGLGVPPNHLALAMRAAGRQRHSDLLIHPQWRRTRGLLTVSVPRFTPGCLWFRFRIVAGERSCIAFLFAHCLFQQFLHSCDLLLKTLVLTQRPVQTSLQGCHFPLQLFDATDRITRTHPA